MTNTAIITGGSLGLGRALATALVRDGWRVVLDGRDRPALERAVHEIGDGAFGVPGDVTDARHRERLVARAWDLGGLHLLVNNASTLGPSPLPALRDHPLDVLEQVFRVNVVAPLGLVQVALPLLRSSGGAVLNVTSDAAVEAYEGWGGYGSSKAALEQLTRVLAAEQPARRIYAVDPGDMNTRMQQEAFPGEDVSDRPPPGDSVPGLLVLAAGELPSGRYRAAELAAVAG